MYLVLIDCSKLYRKESLSFDRYVEFFSGASVLVDHLHSWVSLPKSQTGSVACKMTVWFLCMRSIHWSVNFCMHAVGKHKQRRWLH